MQQVESHWSRLGPSNSMTGVLRKAEIWTQTHAQGERHVVTEAEMR